MVMAETAATRVAKLSRRCMKTMVAVLVLRCVPEGLLHGEPDYFSSSLAALYTSSKISLLMFLYIRGRYKHAICTAPETLLRKRRRRCGKEYWDSLLANVCLARTRPELTPARCQHSSPPSPIPSFPYAAYGHPGVQASLDGRNIRIFYALNASSQETQSRHVQASDLRSEANRREPS